MRRSETKKIIQGKEIKYAQLPITLDNNEVIRRNRLDEPLGISYTNSNNNQTNYPINRYFNNNNNTNGLLSIAQPNVSLVRSQPVMVDNYQYTNPGCINQQNYYTTPQHCCAPINQQIAVQTTNTNLYYSYGQVSTALDPQATDNNYSFQNAHYYKKNFGANSGVDDMYASSYNFYNNQSQFN